MSGGMYYRTCTVDNYGLITYLEPIKLFDLPTKEYRIHNHPIEAGELHLTFEEIEGIIHYHIYTPTNTVAFLHLEQMV